MVKDSRTVLLYFHFPNDGLISVIISAPDKIYLLSVLFGTVQ